MERRSEVLSNSTTPKKGKKVVFDKIEVLQSNHEKGINQVGDQGELGQIRCWINELKRAEDIQFALYIFLCGMVLIFFFTLGALMLDHFYFNI